MTNKTTFFHILQPIDATKVNDEDYAVYDVRNKLEDWEQKIGGTTLSFNIVPIMLNGTTVALFVTIGKLDEDW